MTSKEVLEYLRTCKFCKIVMGTDYENDDRYFTLYDVFNEEIEIIEKDLERLEELEKENQKLKEIIKDNFGYEKGFTYCNQVYFKYDGPVMEEEIKEVLKNE